MEKATPVTEAIKNVQQLQLSRRPFNTLKVDRPWTESVVWTEISTFSTHLTNLQKLQLNIKLKTKQTERKHSFNNPFNLITGALQRNPRLTIIPIGWQHQI